MGIVMLCLACVLAQGVEPPAQLHVLEGTSPLSDGSVLVFRGAGFSLAIGPAPEGSLVLDPEAGSPDDYAAIMGEYLRSPLAACDFGDILYERDGISLVRLDPERTVALTEATVRLRPLVEMPVRPELPRSVSFDPWVEQIVAAVSQDSIISIIGRLEDFGNRYWSSDSFPAARNWAITRLESMGYEVEVQAFPVGTSGGFSQNLIVTIPGTVYPGRYWMIGGHLDSGHNPYEAFPGADDNASGAVTALEAARTMLPYQFEYTVKIALWGAEEAGLVGSSFYAAEAAAAGDSIMGYVNLDMILYGPVIGPSNYDIVRVYYNDSSAAFCDLYDQAADLYVPDLERLDTYATTGGSDHVSFWQNGFTALDLCESMLGENPFYHKYDDLIANYLEYFPFGTNVARSAVACIAALAVPVGLGIEGGPHQGSVEVGISPSPAASVVLVQTSGFGSVQASVTLYDLTGREVASTALDADREAELDVSRLQPGVYLVRVAGGDGPAGTARLVVCR
ncbi:MAG TPA: M28 family peptidase [Candidatus Fermentibacter sp.]|nr:M28 family peptidase [Candidatus Fermentibacter sp.]